ncbi:2-dehydro-3-deoxygalactonokinase [Echinimonas agarilytica]|uniref:2-dehydro-3-deoxygalactonokinase n=1 Tax=Echinimonas agarilytica TaxID=1215918 RepID=A0AA41W4D0_9GAMM|nr:2-dehydro-3-deoxygalactonokinase [Echinimonas agarilytica]MCM2678516.1 2-dehydro-3-deoxygalactonokinase [Echinimonas agarilytica]
MTLIQCKYLIIDWGTTNFRAFAMSAEHQLLAMQEHPLGILQVENAQFESALKRVLEGWIDDYSAVPVFMAGMIGSLKGWVNVPYATTPVDCTKLTEKAHQFKLSWGANAVILPGVCHQYEGDKYDVIRGEEIQALGLAKIMNSADYHAILPGTHSKHLEFKGNTLYHFASFLTGELYSVISKHTLLGRDLPKALGDEAIFLKGVNEAQQGAFANRLFLAWTHRLFQNLTAEQIPDYLSGLLIGFELRELDSQRVYIVGGDQLSKLYLQASTALGIEATVVEGNECFLAGMSVLIEELLDD